MKVTIQRQCDGDPMIEDLSLGACEVRLHVDTTVPDTRGDLELYNAAWIAVAIALGWRRYGAVGSPHLTPTLPSDPDTIAVVPVTKTWLMCPACVARHKFVCARCTFAECSCMGGPLFDVELE